MTPMGEKLKDIASLILVLLSAEEVAPRGDERRAVQAEDRIRRQATAPVARPTPELSLQRTLPRHRQMIDLILN